MPYLYFFWADALPVEKTMNLRQQVKAVEYDELPMGEKPMLEGKAGISSSVNVQ